MTEAQFFDAMRAGLWASAVVSAPILVVALAAGLIVGLFQALTSIQEMTLTFVPKLAAIVVVFWLCMGFMSRTLVEFFQSQVLNLIATS